MCFLPYLGFGRGGGAVSPKGLVHNLRVQFFTLGSSKIDLSETYIFDIVTTHSDHPIYVTHVLGSIYAFFTLFGYWMRGGGVLREILGVYCLG